MIATLDETLEEVASLNETQKEHLRKRAKNDLYFFSKGILRYRDLNPETHGAFCRFIQAHEKKRRIALMPRGHLKSTIATIADSGRLALIDPNEYRGLIAGETATTAQNFLTELKGHFENNVLLRSLFAEVIPTRLVGPGIVWSKDVARLVRNTSYKEPTWTAIGVGGTATSLHFNRIKGDDLIGFDAARSPAAMALAKAWCDNIESLMVDQNVDIIDWIGTRWANNDLYYHLMEMYGSRIAVFVREAIENGQIIFPAKHTWEEYEQLQTKAPMVWHAQYCNNPRAGGAKDFAPEVIRSFRFSSDWEEVIFRDDAGNEKRWKVDQLDRVMCADPNSGSLIAPDMAAVACIGLSTDNEVFTLDVRSGRYTPSGFVDLIFDMAKRWKPRVVGIEKAGQQSTQFYFEEKARQEDFFIRVEPLLHRNMHKEERIRKSLEPIVNSGQMHLLPSQVELRKQFADFPANILIDELDAVAYFTQLARKPMAFVAQEERTKVIDLMLRKRSVRTGY